MPKTKYQESTQDRKMKPVHVYYTEDEIKQIRKKANKAVLRLSPFLRKHTIETLGIDVPS